MSLITDTRHTADHIADDAAEFLEDAVEFLDDVRRSHRIRNLLLLLTVVGALVAVLALVQARRGASAEDADTSTVPEDMLRAAG